MEPNPTSPGPDGPQRAPMREPRARGPRLSGYGLGVLLLVVGVVLGIGAIAVVGTGAPLPENTPSVPVPGSRSIELSSGRTYVLYDEHPGALDDERTPPAVQVTGPFGDVEELLPAGDASTYHAADGSEGRPFARLLPAVSGTYELEVATAAGAEPITPRRVHVAPDLSDSNVMVFAAVGLAATASLVAGVIALVVNAVRRGRRRQPAAPIDDRTIDEPAPWAPPDEADRQAP